MLVYKHTHTHTRKGLYAATFKIHKVHALSTIFLHWAWWFCISTVLRPIIYDLQYSGLAIQYTVYTHYTPPYFPNEKKKNSIHIHVLPKIVTAKELIQRPTWRINWARKKKGIKLQSTSGKMKKMRERERKAKQTQSFGTMYTRIKSYKVRKA